MRTLAVAALVALTSTVVGCVSQGDYDQLDFLNKRLAAEKEASEQRALDAEAQADAMRRQLQMKEGELDVQRSMVGNLRSENDRLGNAFDNAQNLINNLDLTPPPPVVIQSALPPALDSALRGFAASHPDAVEYDPARGAVKWKSDLLFASGSDVVKSDAKSTLSSFADVVNTTDAQAFDIVVVGHTDDDPIKHAAQRGHPTNWHLSAHRAIAVARELLEARIAPQRVGVMGYGEYRPVASNDSVQGKAQNRRVDIFLVGEGTVVATGASSGASMAAQAEPQK